MKGIQCIKSAVELVPKEVLCDERVRYIKNIILSVLPDETVITDNTIGILIKVLGDPLKHYDSTTALRTLSESSGIAYTKFLAPPTSVCLTECCQKFTPYISTILQQLFQSLPLMVPNQLQKYV